MHTTTRKSPRRPAGSLFTVADHNRLLAMYMFIVLFHFIEHVLQIIQFFFLDYSRAEAGGLLGEQFPGLLTNETLHFSYNFILFLGLVMLYRGMSSSAQLWWLVALMLQGWHLFEHTILQFQWLTGWYWFGADRQTSVLENFIPRIELHFMYNTIVTIPIVIAVLIHIYQRYRLGSAWHLTN